MSLLHSLFRQKSWANQELFNLLASLQGDEHGALLHSARRMLNHIYVVDCIFQAHLLGQPHSYTATNTEATPELGTLQFEVAQTDAWFEDYAARLDANLARQQIAFRFTDGDAGRMSREEMLGHVLTHGAYHRGNVGQMLRGASLAPPRDLFTKFLHVSEPERRQG